MEGVGTWGVYVWSDEAGLEGLVIGDPGDGWIATLRAV